MVSPPPPFPPLLPVGTVDISLPHDTSAGAVAGTIAGIGILILLAGMYYVVYRQKASKALPVAHVRPASSTHSEPSRAAGTSP